MRRNNDARVVPTYNELERVCSEEDTYPPYRPWKTGHNECKKHVGLNRKNDEHANLRPIAFHWGCITHLDYAELHIRLGGTAMCFQNLIVRKSVNERRARRDNHPIDCQLGKCSADYYQSVGGWSVTETFPRKWLKPKATLQMHTFSVNLDHRLAVNFKTLSETASKCKFAVGFKFIKNLTLQISVFVQTLTANRARGLSTVWHRPVRQFTTQIWNDKA